VKKEELKEKDNECKHLWMDLGSSAQNGKRYRRCGRCGQVKEDSIPYIG